MSRDWVLDGYTSASASFYTDFDAVDDDLGTDVAPLAGDTQRWRRTSRRMWTEWNYAHADDLPGQGWKIHVSATTTNCCEVLDLVAGCAFRHGVDFKFVRSSALLAILNGKNAPRSASGKFVTLYPGRIPLFEQLHRELADLLASFEGPRILSDLRIGSGPVHVRYGAFSPMHCLVEGVLLPAIVDGRGAVVPEYRQPSFRVPEWVELPSSLQAAVEQQKKSARVDVPFTVSGALQFSNAGGVYFGTENTTGADVVILEGRPHAGTDSAGDDGRRRADRQAHVLEALQGLPGVPRLRGHHVAAEHALVVVDRIDGENLTQAMLDRHPFVQKVDPTADEVASYAGWVMDTWHSLLEVVDRIHRHGFAHGDIHLDNVVIDRLSQPWLVDFEYAGPAQGPCRGVGANGYQPPRSVTAKAGDDYQMACLLLDLLLPLPLLPHLDEGQPGRVIAEVLRRYDLDGPLVEWLHSALGLAKRPGGESEPLTVDPDCLLEGAVLAVRRNGRLPGSPEFPDGYDVSVWHGLSGLVHVQRVLHGSTDASAVERLAELAGQQTPTHGLLLGSLGVAAVLDDAGRYDVARAMLDRLVEVAPPAVMGLAAGTAGTAVGLLRLGERWADLELVERGLHQLARIEHADVLPAKRSTGSPLGLCTGSAGIAWAFLDAFETTGDARYLRAAEEHLSREVDTDGFIDDGQFLLVEHRHPFTRKIPYIDRGSAGWSLAAARYAAVADNRVFDARILACLRACRAIGVREPGLANGRAGLAATLTLLGDDEDQNSADEQVRMLGPQLATWEGHQATPGSKLLRLSMDLATGSLGVALVADLVRARRPAWDLHPLMRVRRMTATKKGGDKDGHPRPAGTRRGVEEQLPLDRDHARLR